MRILSITGNRADYDLMSYLYKYFNEDPEIEFKLIVTGAHLTKGYEQSIEDIEKDGNDIICKIENILNSDTKGSRAKSTGILLMSIADVVRQFDPDLLIAPGDREEVIAMATVATYMQIPFLHFFGGDFAESGHVDNLARQAASKMATAHFVSLDEHKERLIKLGEDEKTIFMIGSVALDKFSEEPVMSVSELMQKMNLENFTDYALLIYHPPAEIDGTNLEIKYILDTLKEKRIKTVVSYPNTDYNNSEIIAQFERYFNDSDFYFYKNLDRNTFINLYRNAMFQIGNSSSGVCEAASIPIPVINIGSRQRNRGNTENVIYVEDVTVSLSEAIDKVQTSEYKNKIKSVKNILGDGHSSERAYKIIKNTDFTKMLYKTYDPLKEDL